MEERLELYKDLWGKHSWEMDQHVQRSCGGELAGHVQEQQAGQWGWNGFSKGQSGKR